VKYACIARHRGEFHVRLMCRVLDVSESGFYASVRRTPSIRSAADQRLTLHVRAFHKKSSRRYGAPRIHRDLRDIGIQCGRKRVARIMRANGLKARRTRRFCVTTKSDHAHPIAPNTLDREFDINAIGQVNRVWAADITYIPTREGWLYLSMVMDLASRRIVGWATSSLLEALSPTRTSQRTAPPRVSRPRSSRATRASTQRTR